MNTPICDFVESYAKSNSLRLHMPGHKGKGVLFDYEKYDITEIYGADSLHSATGIIRQSEQNLTAIFDTGASFYSCEGSSLCVRAMLYLARLYSGEKRGYILATRNAHSSLISAAALLDFDIEWLYQGRDEAYLSCKITPEALDKKLRECEKKPFCVYITSPDYLGGASDIKGLSGVCEKHGTLLTVDNAHGAYLKFLTCDSHPISLGAHLCCDSAHKTLPCLTGGAYLHVSKRAPKMMAENAKDALSLFATTSPSYLILASLDMLNKYLSQGYSQRLNSFIEKVRTLKDRLRAYGYEVIEGEELKVVINASAYGYAGTELGALIKKDGLVWEMCDPDFLVLMLTPENGDEALEKIYKAFAGIERREKIIRPVVSFVPPKQNCSIRDAVMLQREKISIDSACGRVCAGINAFCPPAVSLIVAGEVFTEEIITALKYYGFDAVSVLK